MLEGNVLEMTTLNTYEKFAVNETDNIVAAPPEDLSDEEIFDKSNKLVPYKKINENTSAGRLRIFYHCFLIL